MALSLVRDRAPAENAGGDEGAEALVRRARDGDQTALRALLSALAPLVLRATRRVLGGRHPDVDDVAQQALVAFVHRLPMFRAESSVEHFAERIAVYRALSARRQASFRQRVAADAAGQLPDADPGPTPFAIVASRARTALLRDALDNLAPPQAEALALHFLLDHTVGEIAAMSGVPEETVRSRLRLGKQALRTLVETEPRFRALRADDGVHEPSRPALEDEP